MQTKLDTITHNLANSNTVGYKADKVEFSEYMERVMRGDGGLGNALGTMGTGPVESQRYIVREMGTLNSTTNPLDLAINNEKGAFSVKVGDQTMYTRNGAFSMNQDNLLVNQQGYAVLDDRGTPIRIDPTLPVAIDGQGNIAQDGRAVAKLGMFDSDKFQKVGSNLLRADAAVPIDVDIKSGALENSNVNSIEAMVDMIKLSRIFELAQKAITSEDESTQKLIQGFQNP